MPEADDNILHEADVEAAVEAHLEEAGKVAFTHPAIDDCAAATGSYVQAQANEVVDAVNDMLAVLRANGLIEESA